MALRSPSRARVGAEPSLPPSLPILSAVRVGSDALEPEVNPSSETRLSPRPPERTLRTGLEGWDLGWQPQLLVLSGTQLCGLVYKALSIASKAWGNAALETGANPILPGPPFVK